MPILAAQFEVPLLDRWAQVLGWHGYELKALLAVLLISGLCGMVGALVVANRMAFFSDAMAHCAFAGISLGLVIWLALGNNRSSEILPTFLTLVMASFGALIGVGIAFVRERTDLASDTVIGVFFAGALGFGAIILEAFPKGRGFDVEKFLFGGPYATQSFDLAILAGLFVLAGLVFVWRYNQFVLASFNASLARSRGIKAAANNYLFILLLALIVNFSISAVGVLLINALLIVPAATATNLSANMRQMFRYTFGLSVLTGLAGLLISASVRIEVAPGELRQFGVSGTIICLGVALFVCSMGYSMAISYLRRRFAHLG